MEPIDLNKAYDGVPVPPSTEQKLESGMKELRGLITAINKQVEKNKENIPEDVLDFIGHTKKDLENIEHVFVTGSRKNRPHEPMISIPPEVLLGLILAKLSREQDEPFFSRTEPEDKVECTTQ